GIEEVVPFPAFSYRRQGGRIKIHDHLLSRAEDHEVVIYRLQQRQYVSVFRVRPNMAGVRTAEAHIVVVVIQIAGESALVGTGIAVEVQTRPREPSFMQVHIRRLRSAVINEDTIPIDLKVGDNANLARARLQLAG